MMMYTSETDPKYNNAMIPIFGLWNAKLPRVDPTTGNKIVYGPKIAWNGAA